MSAFPAGPFCPVNAKLAYNFAKAPFASLTEAKTFSSVKLSGSIGDWFKSS